VAGPPSDSPDCPRFASDFSPVCPDYPLIVLMLARPMLAFVLVLADVAEA